MSRYDDNKPTDVAYHFELKSGEVTEKRHVVVYGPPGKLFEFLAQVIKEFGVDKSAILLAKETRRGDS